MKFACFVLLACLPLAVSGQQLGIPSGVYAVDPGHAYVTFSYEHQGLSYPLLRAVEVNGELKLDASDIENSSVAIAVATDSIRSNVDFFDRELASPKFFNAAKFPHITFTAERLAMRDEDSGVLEGEVTIRGITRPLALDVTINGAMQHPMTGTPVLGVSATGSLNRTDFELDRFVPAVSDRVDLGIEIEFVLGSNAASAAAAATARGGAGG
ncbi:MAG: YceI family protein [Woeseiaceae bacterium]|nr:YceI family protein [Woeseiaceae bacterium]